MYKTLAVSVRNGVQIIQMNRPEKRNAINEEMYKEIPEALQAGATDGNVVVTVLTGAGGFFCSGNDLNSYLTWNGTDLEKTCLNAATRLQSVSKGPHLKAYVQAFIDFPKILVAVVNGPAVGLATTTLALFDLVYCSKIAYFSAPFVALGLTPEGCSSYTFPKMLGANRAAQMLHFGKKLTATEALEWGFVTELYAAGEENKIWSKIDAIAQLPSKSLIFSKRLLRSQERASLYEANRKECEQLVERWQSEDCMNAVVKFFGAKKSKL